MTNTVKINRGSARSVKIIWPGSPTTPMDLPGWTVSVFEPHPALDGHLTLTITDAAAGEISGALDWQDDMPMRDEMTFRAKIVNGSANMTTPLITFEVQ